jgi:hypothetical protein
MDWTELKNKIYYCDGSWRDIYVSGTSVSDWKKWVDYVNEHYLVNSLNGKTNQDEKKIDFATIKGYWAGDHDFCTTAKVFVDNLQINAHFFDNTELENDIDPSEVNSIDDHNKLIKFMTDLSNILNKAVILTPENGHEIVLIKVHKGRIYLMKGINPIN